MIRILIAALVLLVGLAVGGLPIWAAITEDETFLSTPRIRQRYRNLGKEAAKRYTIFRGAAEILFTLVIVVLILLPLFS